MQRDLTGLNPSDGDMFVAAYVDDILAFSCTLSDHIDHLAAVIGGLREANLKLKPSKCKFARHEFEYLGHLITPRGLQPNIHLTSAIQAFPRLRNVPVVRRFLGMTSYYRHLIPHFAHIAQPLHRLTSKDAPFTWSNKAQSQPLSCSSSSWSPLQC